MSTDNTIDELCRLLLAYRKPTEDLAGVRTFVRKDDDVSESTGEDGDRTKSPALPLKKRRKRRLPLSDGGSSEVRTVGYNTPESGANLPSVKTLSEPGEERGVPYKSSPLLTRRTMEGGTILYREEKSPQDLESPLDEEEKALPTGRYPDSDTKGSPSKMLRPERQQPSYKSLEVDVPDAAGSARVIPYDSGFENKKATKMSEITRSVSPQVIERARKYNPSLLGQRDGVWTYRVGKWEVKVESATPNPTRRTKLDLADLKITCSCPFWRWQGPEHWGQQEDYLKGPPRGTASFPGVRDPEHDHAVCKHAYAVFEKVRKFRRRAGNTKAVALSVAYSYLNGE